MEAVEWLLTATVRPLGRDAEAGAPGAAFEVLAFAFAFAFAFEAEAALLPQTFL